MEPPLLPVPDRVQRCPSMQIKRTTRWLAGMAPAALACGTGVGRWLAPEGGVRGLMTRRRREQGQGPTFRMLQDTAPGIHKPFGHGSANVRPEPQCPWPLHDKCQALEGMQEHSGVPHSCVSDGGPLRPKNGPTRFSQWQISFVPTVVTLVWRGGGSLGGAPPLLVWCTAVGILPCSPALRPAPSRGPCRRSPSHYCTEMPFGFLESPAATVPRPVLRPALLPTLLPRDNRGSGWWNCPPVPHGTPHCVCLGCNHLYNVLQLSR